MAVQLPSFLGIARHMIDLAAKVSLIVHELHVAVVRICRGVFKRSRRSARLTARLAIRFSAEYHFDVLGDAEDAFLDAVAFQRSIFAIDRFGAVPKSRFFIELVL